jgi:hypothetical protein
LKTVLGTVIGVCAVVALGCSSVPPLAAPADGGADASDAAPADAAVAAVDQGQADAPADGAAAPDGPDLGDGSGGDADAGPDGPCVSFAGLYQVTGVCDTDGATFGAVDCVVQTACQVQVSTGRGQLLGGMASGPSVALTGMTGLNQGVTQDFSRQASGVLQARAHFPGGILASGAVDCTLGFTRLDTTGIDGLCCTPAAPGQTDPCGDSAQCAVIPVVLATGPPVLTTGCVPRGKLAAGAACTRDDVTLRSPCAPGTLCTSLGSTDGSHVCQPLCRTPADCTDGRVCYWFDGNGSPASGLCVPPCTPAAAGACPTGTSCRLASTLDPSRPGLTTVCTPDGALARGATCDFTKDLVIPETPGCTAGLDCVTDSTGGASCQPLCRVGGTDCASGETCTNTSPLPSAVGVCGT